MMRECIIYTQFRNVMKFDRGKVDENRIRMMQF